MAAPFIGRSCCPDEPKTKKPQTRDAANLRLWFKDFCRLCGCWGAVGIERACQFLGNRRRGRSLDGRALHQVDELAVAQDLDCGRRGGMSAEVAAGLLGGVAVLPCEYRH